MGLTFDAVLDIGRGLADVAVDRYYGVPALKLGRNMLACVAINKSAEPNSAVITVGVDERQALIAKDPDVYYVTDHYAPFPHVLVRLSRVSRPELQRLLRRAWARLSTDSTAPPPLRRGARSASRQRR